MFEKIELELEHRGMFSTLGEIMNTVGPRCT